MSVHQLSAVQDKLLTNVSNKLVPMGYVSEQLLTPLSSKNTTGKIGSYGNGGLRIENTLMAGGGKAPSVDSVTRSSSTYSVERHGLEGIVTPDDFANVDEPFDARKDETESLTSLLWLSKEKALADTLADTAIVTQNVTLSGSGQYSDFANSDPLGDFITARSTIRNSVGLPPNGCVMDWDVAEVLRYHPAILEALGFKDNRAGSLSDQELASALKVDKLLVAKSVYNSANQGQSDSIAAVWGKHIVFFHAPSSPMKMQKSLGYYITLQGRGSRKAFRSSISNPPESEQIVVVDDYDFFLTDANAAYLLKNAIA